MLLTAPLSAVCSGWGSCTIAGLTRNTFRREPLPLLTVPPNALINATISSQRMSDLGGVSKIMSNVRRCFELSARTSGLTHNGRWLTGRQAKTAGVHA